MQTARRHPACRAIAKWSAAGSSAASNCSRDWDCYWSRSTAMPCPAPAATTNRWSCTTATGCSRKHCSAGSSQPALKSKAPFETWLLLWAAGEYRVHGRPLADRSDQNEEQQLLAAVCGSICLREVELVQQHLPRLIELLKNLPLLYVPLSRGRQTGRHRRIAFEASGAQRIARTTSQPGVVGVKRQTSAEPHLEMERELPPGPGAVTEFDELFRCAYSAGVSVLIQAGKQLRPPADSTVPARKIPRAPLSLSASNSGPRACCRCGWSTVTPCG